MFKGKLVFLSLIAALLCLQVMPASVDTANSGIVDPCSTTAEGDGCCYVICPQGDGTRFDDPVFCGAIISIQAKDATGAPIPGIPPQDIWLIGCNDQIVLCGGSASIGADSATNDEGRTTISGDLAGGGCDLDGLSVVVQSVVVDDPATLCTTTLCLPYTTVSPDINGDLIVDIIDFSLFATAYGPPPVYDACLDYNCDGFLDIVDFSIFAIHYLHAC